MASSRSFECLHCGAVGTIRVQGDDFTEEDIVHCPLCASDIYEDDEQIEDELDDDMDS